MVEALIVQTRRRGPGQMLGLEDTGARLLDQVTSGEYSKVTNQLDRLELALQVSIVASCIAGIAALAMLMRHR